MSTIQENDEPDALMQQILNGAEHVVSHPGTSQYGGREGISACGLACLNFARVIFAKEAGESCDDILQTVIASETAHEVTAICAGATFNSHLEVEDICRVPLFDQTLKLVSTRYGRPGLKQFTNLLQGLQTIDTSCAVIITRPPEIIACMKLVVHSTDVFVIFDSHSRPDHPDGAVFILNTSVHRTAAHLRDILPVDRRLVSDNDLQWQAQLLANFSGHILVSSGQIPLPLMQTVTECSLMILALRAEVSDLKFQNSILTSENKRLESELQTENKRRDERIKLLSSSFKYHDSNSHSASAQLNNAVAGPSRSSDRTKVPRAQKQRDIDKMDQHLATQDVRPAKTLRKHFECRICMEVHVQDNVARIDSCGHRFCRECVKGYVAFKLSENRFPVLCPVCMTEKKGEPGVVTNGLVQQIGITERQYNTWVELEMAQFSVLLHCRGCKRSTFVDKQDFETMKILFCPLPDCAHIWCNACQQSIVLGGPEHSCDGSSELDSLMKERGWKYCPSCKTPFQKETGCNHMTCMSPGCNTHFCYVCGDQIIKSALPSDVQAATATHFSKCQLFEDVADSGVPP